MSEQKKPTKALQIIRYRELGKKYENASEKLPEPIRSSYLRIAETLYKSANQLEGENNE